MVICGWVLRIRVCCGFCGMGWSGCWLVFCCWVDVWLVCGRMWRVVFGLVLMVVCIVCVKCCLVVILNVMDLVVIMCVLCMRIGNVRCGLVVLVVWIGWKVMVVFM